VTGAPLARDHAARARAATDFATNLVVSAGAGTGKTSLLVERALAAIGSGHGLLLEIAAITFTDKAAGELRHRLASELRRLRELARGGTAGDGPSPAKNAYRWLTEVKRETPEAIAARVAEAEAKLDRAVVTTIHGFCSEILRAHPLASGLPPGFIVDRGPAVRRLASEAWTPFLAGELGLAGTRAALWERVLGTFDLGVLEEIARVLSGGAVPRAALETSHRPVDVLALFAGEAARLADAIGACVAATAGLTDAPRRWLEEAQGALRAFATGGLEAAQRAIAAASRIPDRMPSVKTKKVSPAEAELLLSLERSSLSLLRAFVKLDPRREADLFEALLPFARTLRASQTRAGIVDFDGLLVRTRDLLRDCPEIRAAQKGRFGMILVDEFQDTDPIQYEIVFFLAERIGENADDAYRTRLAPGRLFIVGDAKQSIYRFRGADFAAFRRAVLHVLEHGGAELTLTSNFRSTASILGSVNALFAGPAASLWNASDYLPPYEPLNSERGGDEAPAVEIWTTPAAAGALAAARRRAEGLALAAELRSMAGPGRPWRYHDVLVLFRSFTGVPAYLRALREAQIPFVISGGRNFFERTEIVQAMAVLRAVTDPDDPVAELAYRRSPAGGVPDVELFAAAHGGVPGPALAEADRRLALLRAEAERLPADAAVRRILDESGFVALSGLSFEAAQRVANLEKLALAASELARDGRLTLAETLDALEEGFEAEEEGDSPLADPDRDAIRVMTIHAAKGLEAPVVILADTAGQRSGRPPSRFSAGTMRTDAGEHVRLAGPSFENAAAIAASLDDYRHEEAEHVRLLYVALTRARDRLIVFGGGRGRSAWDAALASWTDGVTTRTLSEASVERAAERLAAAGAPGAVARFQQAAAVAVAWSLPAWRAPSGEEDGETRTSVAGALAPELARAVGRIFHAMAAGLPSPDTGAARDEAEALFRSFTASPLGARWAALDVLGREVSMLFAEDGARWHGAIDLLFRDGDGTIVVVDFKTDADEANALERHGEQLRVYTRAVRRALSDTRVRAELWMIRSARVLEV